ncbi:MAG TPA: protein kinase [Thermoanaerobaculia bacterium]|nr:protein kinase [Thermoanaerobaculia bacterium]
MIGQKVANYEILERLGAGGMGVVFRARHLRLDRPAALKFLPPQLGQDEALKQRFLQEARAASALDHPNICTIYDVGETADGQLFIAMAYYPGETLRARIERGPLPLAEALDVALGIARGLGQAHGAGIVHRDVKPANVMVDGRGEVKLLDFGLAKLAGEERLTRTGSSLGTPAYMAPEQVLGEEVGPAADLWALGVVLHEMLAGALPFAASDPRALAYAILHQDPEPLPARRPEAPEALARLVRRALSRDPAARHPGAAALAAELLAIRGALDLQGPTLAMPGDGTGSGAAAPQRRSIAVLPFADMSPQRDQDWFCEGLAEELLNALVKIDRLQVASRTSSFQFQGATGDIREIGRKLGVDTVLEGSVRKAGNRLRITAQLIGVADGYHLWSERYDRDLEDIFAIQDEIAQSIVAALQVTLTPRERQAMQQQAPDDVEAYQYYLRGIRFLHRKDTDLPFARQMFQRAIEIDPGYARAWAGLAEVGCMIYLNWGHATEALEEAAAASARAVELAPGLAEARTARGLFLSLDKRFTDANGEFEQAVVQDPKLYEAWYFWGRSRWAEGELEEAARLFERAGEVSPGDFQALGLAQSVYRGLERGDDGRRVATEALARVTRHLELNPDDVRAQYYRGNCFADLDRMGEALACAARAVAMAPNDPSVLYNVACTYVKAGRFDEALDHLDRAADNGFSHPEWMANDGDLAPLRSDSRFAAILARTARE